MDFNTANDMEVPFGKYKGKTLWEVFQKDPKYIDFMCGMNLFGRFKEAVDVFSKNDDVARKIDSVVYD
jgi:hypothetical protein